MIGQSGHFGFGFTTLCENLATSLLLGWNCYSMHTRLFRCECKEQGLPIFENIARVRPFAEILMTIKPDCRFKYCNSKNSFSTAATKSNWFSSGKSKKYHVAYLIFGPKRGELNREGGGLIPSHSIFHEIHNNFSNSTMTTIIKKNRKMVLYYHFKNALSFINFPQWLKHKEIIAEMIITSANPVEMLRPSLLFVI